MLTLLAIVAALYVTTCIGILATDIYAHRGDRNRLFG
jgi:hypothetical protein